MAYQTLPLYNIHSSVGKGGVNRADDVRLIEALLIELDRWIPGELPNSASLHGMTLQPLSLTGCSSTNLENWIKTFQYVCSGSGIKNPDGRIDPFTFSWGGGSLKTTTAGNKTLAMWTLLSHVGSERTLGYQQIASKVGLKAATV